MKVTKTSPFSGEKHTIEVDVSEEADHMRYDREAVRAFWGCYTVVVLLVGFLCYKYLWS